MTEPIVQIYIKNYQSNGQIVTDENVLQTVPFQGDPAITNPKVKGDMGKAGSFEFGLELNSPFYDSLLQMKTLMRVTLFGRSIFRGRVLTIDKTLSRTRTVHCEGDFAFLLDSHQDGTKEETRPTIGVLQYLQQILDQHNLDMTGEPEKQFYLGEVPGQYSTADVSQRVAIPSEKASQQFGDTSYNTSMDRLEGLLGDFGGYFRTRYDATTGRTYLDWFDKYYDASLNAQTIEITKNLIDLGGSTEVANLFTIVIPIGKGNESESIFISDYWPIVQAGHSKVNYITVPELATIPLYSDADLNSDYHRKADYANAITRFGKIWKTVDFENANSPEKLFMYAKDWMKNNFMPELTQWSVTALDMKIVDHQNQALYVGDRVNLIHPEVDQSYPGMTVISCNYDLYNPQNNKYVIGIPNQEINSAYGVKNKVDKGTGTKKSGKGGGGGRKKPPPEDPNAELEAQIAKMRARLLTEYSYKTDSGGDIHRDDPIAYNMYNTDGTEKSRAEIVKSIQESSANLFYTKQTKQMEIINEAIRRGVSPDDPQLLIDLTPKEKAKQNKFKSDSEYYYVNTVGMTMEESALLLNDSASQSWLAALVDDDGNWTETAYSKGCMIWNDRDNIKQQAINARKGFAGTRKQNGFDVWSTVKDSVNSVTSKVGNWLSADGLSNTFDIGNLWTDVTSGKSFGDILGISGNTDGGTLGNTFNFLKGMFTGEDKGGTIGNVFKLSTNNTVVDGEHGKQQLRSSTDKDWQILLNQEYTYVGADGQEHTADGFIHADDFNLVNVPSFKTTMASVNTLLADYAQIDTLTAMNATIGTLTTTKLTTTSLSSEISNLDAVRVKGIGGITGVYVAGDLLVKTCTRGLIGAKIVPVGNDGYKLQILTTTGEDWSDAGSFNKGDAEAAYKQGWNECIGAATEIANCYERSTIGGGGAYGGSYYAHYIFRQGRYENVGTGWYTTSSIHGYTLPAPKS